MSRSAIREAMQQIPLERIVQGEGKNNRLTSKQKKFAEQLALGNTKAGAYREAYNTEAKPKTQSENGRRLALNKAIQREVEAYKVALEAEKYRTAVQTKALILQQLTEHALNEDNPPQVRLNALRMLGQSYDVGLFVERKEITTVNNSKDIKAQLLDKLKSVIKTNAVDVEADDADSLMLELRNGEPTVSPSPLFDEGGMVADRHSIPHNRTEEIPHNRSQDISVAEKQHSQVIDLEEKKVLSGNVTSCDVSDPTPSVLETPPVDEKGPL